MDADRLLAIALREFKATQEEFRTVAGRLDGGDPIAAWRKAKEEHPAPGQLAAAAQEQLDELGTFIDRNGIVTRPEGEPVIVAPTPEFYRWSFASMWVPGPFEQKPTRAYYYLTDADPSWPAEKQEEHLRDFNYPTLWAISIHEVYPGHFLHYQFLRRVESKVRKSIMFSPASFVEGWAHYSEQMMIDAGFRRNDQTLQARPAGRSAHPSGALHRQHPAARRRLVGGAGHAVLPRRDVSWRRAARGARPSAARSIRPISSTRSAS